MSTLYSSGVVTAYGAAVAGGYEGTYAQFCQDMANIASAIANPISDEEIDNIVDGGA